MSTGYSIIFILEEHQAEEKASNVDLWEQLARSFRDHMNVWYRATRAGPQKKGPRMEF